MGCFLTNSSLGRKLVMSITGCFLVLFIFFHMSMNVVAIINGDAYNLICKFLGANWYALAATVVLAGGVLVHFLYAFWLTLQNRKARGNVRYSVTVKEHGVSWASKNMLVLGIIVILGLALHLVHFWSKMQLVELQEIMGFEPEHIVDPTDGAKIIQLTFSKWYNVVLYLVWFVALWFHLTHGVWSMCQTAGLANDTWYPRLKKFSNLVATLIFVGFAVVAVWTYVVNCPCCKKDSTCCTECTAPAAEVAAPACCTECATSEAAPAEAPAENVTPAN